jgi:hypothetical protein
MDQVLQGLDHVVCSQDDTLMESDYVVENHLAVLED